MILMNQPFAGLVKELFEPQKYPQLIAAPLRCHRLDAAVSDGRRGSCGDYAAGAGIRRSVPKKIDFDQRLRRAVQSQREREPPRGESDSGREGLRSDSRARIFRFRISTSRKLDSILAENHLKAVAAARGIGKPVKAGAHRPVPVVSSQYGRRLDALDSGTVRVPVHDLLQRRHSAPAICARNST